ncbi:unnamed protein product, partial [Mesorhabditis spiculigera]
MFFVAFGAMFGAFILTVLFVGVHAEDCEEGWTPYKVMNSCYKMVNGQAFWHAEAECAEQGAHLTSILNDEENQFIEDMISTKIPGNDAWVGAMVMTRNDTQHYWMDGSPVSQKVGKWAVEVLDKTMTRFCILKNGDGRFEQKSCTDLNKGICKRPMGQAAVTPPSKSGEGQETCIEIAAAAGSHSTYLGAKRDSSGQFQWIDGSTWDYAFWTSYGRPDEFKTFNCLVTSDTVEPNSHDSHRWAARDCDEVRATLCKKPGNPKPTA